MTNIKYIDFKRAETIIWTVGIGTVFFVVTYLNSTNKLFVWYTIIFGAIALLCSIFIAIRFIDVYYSFYEENNANWQPYGVYKKSIGQNSSIVHIIDPPCLKVSARMTKA